MAPFFKLNKIAEELAISLDFDPDDIVNDPEEAKLFAQILGEISTAADPMAAAGAPGGAPGVPGGPTGTGDGTIGTGGAPGPSEPGFSGNTGGEQV